MKLRKVHGVHDYIRWLQSKGITPSQNVLIPAHVDMVHTAESYHYKENKGHGIHFAPNHQGDLAVDVNDNDVSDDNFTKRMFSEQTSLTLVFYKTRAMAMLKHWPLHELFFNRLGFMEVYGPRINHPVPNHETHLHAGFNRETW